MDLGLLYLESCIRICYQLPVTSYQFLAFRSYSSASHPLPVGARLSLRGIPRRVDGIRRCKARTRYRMALGISTWHRRRFFCLHYRRSGERLYSAAATILHQVVAWSSGPRPCHKIGIATSGRGKRPRPCCPRKRITHTNDDVRPCQFCGWVYNEKRSTVWTVSHRELYPPVVFGTAKHPNTISTMKFLVFSFPFLEKTKSIFDAHSLKTQNSKLKTKGFTLIELLVVSAIVVMLATVILSSHGKFGGQVLLQNFAYDVALSIRQAQVY